MYKIRKVEFINHYILGNLKLDFCDLNGNAVDSIIIAGENGVGKSKIIDAIYRIVTGENDFEANLEIEVDSQIRTLNFYKNKYLDKEYIYVKDNLNMNTNVIGSEYLYNYKFKAIYSDVDINFKSENIPYVTSMDLDSLITKNRSNSSLSKSIKQLLIDIKTMDDSDFRDEYDKCRELNCDTNTMNLNLRMDRFKNAFHYMFETLEFDRIVNVEKHKDIIFKKNGVAISIDSLSSGEKQIIYRGSFLLKDVNSLYGALVFIDEPEISLHPKWQEKILDYYKKIFTDSNGKQTSQMFFVTHSPFIVHNKNRNNDKVIILKRNNNGLIAAEDKKEYYKCDSIEVVEDAFNILYSVNLKPTVYVEGRTDELYFKKAIEVFNFNDIPFQFKWCGYLKANGQEENTGKDALNAMFKALVSSNHNFKNMCLFDCDTNKEFLQKNNVMQMSIPFYSNQYEMNKGIENALILADVDLSQFYTTKNKKGDYGVVSSIQEFEKMKLCEHICSLSVSTQKEILQNLKDIIIDLIEKFS